MCKAKAHKNPYPHHPTPLYRCGAELPRSHVATLKRITRCGIMAKQEDEKMISVLCAAGRGIALPHPAPSGARGCGEAIGAALPCLRRSSEDAWQRGGLGHG